MTTATKKKDGLTRIPSKTQPESAGPGQSVTVNNPPTVPPAKVTDFVPIKERAADDLIPDGEDWKTKRAREEAEGKERLRVVSRMTETEQLGLATGLEAEKVLRLRKEVKHQQKRLAETQQNLTNAEATLNARLDQLRKVGL